MRWSERPERWTRAAAATLLPAAVAVGLSIARDPRVVYTSDSAAQQSIVRTWLDVGHGVTHLPPDTWALKFPLYLALELLPMTPLHRLLAAVVIVNALTFVLAGLAVLLLAPRARWYELAAPMAWLAALGGGFGSNRNLTNYRNIELGLCFLALVVVARYLDGPQRPDGGAGRGRRYASTAGAVLGLALFWFDDPYFAWLVAAPLTAASLVWFALRRREIRHLRLAGVLAASLAVLQLLQLAVRRAGIHVDHTKELSPGPSAAVQHLDQLVAGAATQFGVERWNGQPAGAIVAQVLTLAALAMLAGASAVLACWGWRSKSLVAWFIPVSVLLAVAGTLVQQHHPSRYLILVPFSLAISAVIILPVLRTAAPWPARALIAVLAGAAISTAWLSAAQAASARSRPSVALTQQQALIEAVRATGTAKGFAPFWSANITSYLVGGGTTVYELRCVRGQLLANRTWLSDTVRLTRPARQTFLIWVPAYFGPLGCTPQDRDALLGAPAAVQELAEGTQVLVYPRDIARELTSARPGAGP